jgi:hypothetical protein
VTSVEFGRRQVANSIRDRLEPFLDEDDTRRSKTIELQDRVPDDVVQRVREEAADSRQSEADKAGQAGLTDRERREIDFSKEGVNVPYARSVKGIAKTEGVDDWIQYADFDVTVDENRSVLERAGRESRGARGRGRTQEQSDLKRGRQAKERRREQAEEAKPAAFGGNAEAADFLREEQRFEDDLFDISLRGSGPSGSDFERLEDAHEDRSERAQRVDERRSAKVTRDPLKWAQNKSQCDYPGIDTVQPRKLHEQRSKQAQKVDEREQAPIADSREQWAQNPDQFDWPGVDTKQRPTDQEIVERAKEMKSARMDATMRFEPMSQEEEISARASAADISLSPEEATRGVGAVGENALGGFNVTEQGETAPSAPIDERPPDIARGEDPFDMSSDGGVLADTRDQQASLDVGRGAGVTEDRSGKVAGSAGFEDRRDELRGGDDPGEQAGLGIEETNVGGDGQADLFGNDASETSGGEYLK